MYAEILTPGESGLFIANLDGSNEQQIATRKPPQFFFPHPFTGPSWSPDGLLVACSVSKALGSDNVIAVRLADGSETELSPRNWSSIGRVEWIADMSGLFMIARASRTSELQVWFLTYPEGTERPVTNDLNSYRSLSFAADFSKFLTIQSNSQSGIWVAPEGDSGGAVKLPSGLASLSFSDDGASWTPEGRIVFEANTNGLAEVWIIDPDGANRRQLTSGAGARAPVVSPDGRYIVYSSLQDGKRNLWRINSNGSSAQRLTGGVQDQLPALSPDSRWVFYSSLNASGRFTLWRVSVDGGDAIEVTGSQAEVPAVSPDGQFIAYLYAEKTNNQASIQAPLNRIAVIPFGGGDPIKTFSIFPNLSMRTTLRWSADSQALLYTATSNDISNIWSQSLSGGSPRQLTNFTELLMTSFSYSRDGRFLVCTRTTNLRDAVLISD